MGHDDSQAPHSTSAIWRACRSDVPPPGSRRLGGGSDRRGSALLGTSLPALDHRAGDLLWKGVTWALQYLGCSCSRRRVASAWLLQRRLAEISVAWSARSGPAGGLLTALRARDETRSRWSSGSRACRRRPSGPVGPRSRRHLKELENETRRTVAQLQSFSLFVRREGGRPSQDVNELVTTRCRWCGRWRDEGPGGRAGLGRAARVCGSVCHPAALLNLTAQCARFRPLPHQRHHHRTPEGRAEVVVADRRRASRREPDASSSLRHTRAGGNGLASTSREIAQAHGARSPARRRSGARSSSRFPPMRKSFFVAFFSIISARHEAYGSARAGARCAATRIRRAHWRRDVLVNTGHRERRSRSTRSGGFRPQRQAGGWHTCTI